MPVTRWPAGSSGSKGGQFAPGGKGGGAGAARLVPPGLRQTDAERAASDAAWQKIKTWRPPPPPEGNDTLKRHMKAVSGDAEVTATQLATEMQPREVALHLYEIACSKAKRASLKANLVDRWKLATEAQAYYDQHVAHVAQAHQRAKDLGYDSDARVQPSPLRAVALTEHFAALRGPGDLRARLDEYHVVQSSGWLDSSSSGPAMSLHAFLRESGVRGSYAEDDMRRVLFSRRFVDQVPSARVDQERFSAKIVLPSGRREPLDSLTREESHLYAARHHADLAAGALIRVDRVDQIAWARYHYEQYAATAGERRLPDPIQWRVDHDDTLRLYVREMYGLTQAALRDAKVGPTVPLYRGITGPTHDVPQKGDQDTLAARPASSWSDMRWVADRFARDHDPGKAGYVVRDEVPVERIYASHHLFTDTSDEREYVVLGTDGSSVEVVSTYGN